MKVLVTGAKGFIGKNLVTELKNQSYTDIYEYDIDSEQSLLDEYCRDCEFVFNLAGVNRPKEEKEFMEGNLGFTSKLFEKLKKYNNKSTVLITSSIQSLNETEYGRSKKAAEELAFLYASETGASVLVYRLQNVFGKWCKPNYNSVIATFCSNIASDLPIKIDDPNIDMNLIYIDDVVNEFINVLIDREAKGSGYYNVEPVYKSSLGEVVNKILTFKESRENKSIPDMSNQFDKKLYSTYISYLPTNQFKYPLKMNIDDRGSFTEFLKTMDRGQISVNKIKPGIVKGNHWHHTKTEKFMVVHGEGLIQLRKVGNNEIINYPVNAEKLEIVDIPIGYSHRIINIGETELVIIIWVNEMFVDGKSDTYFLEV